MVVAEAANEYLASIKLLELRTQKGYAQRLRVFAVWCFEREIRLEQVNRRVVDDFVEHLKSAHSSHYTAHASISTYTLAGYVRVISAFLNWCLEDDQYSQYVSVSTVRKIKLPKTDKIIQEIFTQDQLEKLKTACDKEETKELQVRARAIVLLLIDTGIRADELVTLKISDVHLQPSDSSIKIMGKGRKERKLPLSDQARRAMKWYLHEYRAAGLERYIKREIEARSLSPQQQEQLRQKLRANAPVFASRDHSSLTVAGLELLMNRLGGYAGLEGVRCNPHKFRHTFAVQFMLNGGDVYRLMLWMGHNNVRTTEEYLKTIQGWELLSQQLERVSR